MADPREALAQIIAGSEWDYRDAEIADAILAEFDVTPRGEDQWWESLVEAACDKGHRIFIDDGDGGVYACPACALLPTVKPSVEDVAREFEYRLRTCAAYFYMRGKHREQGDEGWIERERDGGAERVLALLPGRTEAEVKAEALREAAGVFVNADVLTTEEQREFAAWLMVRANNIEKESDRG